MKVETLALTLILLTCHVFGQDTISHVNGGYIDYISFVNNVPAYKYEFEISKRSNQDIRSQGGNDYQVICKDDTVNANIINKKIWGIFQDDTLYLNGQVVDGIKYYVRVELPGRYSFLRCAFPKRSKILKELGIDTPYSEPPPEYWYGVLGDLMLSINRDKPLPLPRLPIVFDMQTHHRMLLNKMNLIHLLKNHKSLLNGFEAEPDNTREIILLEYLEKLNEAFH
jgi:hypothetical protein